MRNSAWLLLPNQLLKAFLLIKLLQLSANHPHWSNRINNIIMKTEWNKQKLTKSFNFWLISWKFDSANLIPQSKQAWIQAWLAWLDR